MDYPAIVAEALALLQHEKRLSYRVLKLRLQLDDDTLEALKEDLIYAKQLAVDEEGKVLVWAGGAGLGATPPAPAREPARPPRSYTPAYLAEKILTSRGALEGERKQVTVLFADIVGFTTISEPLVPEIVHELMNRCFEPMTAEVHRFEGTINQYTAMGSWPCSARRSRTKTVHVGPCTPPWVSSTPSATWPRRSRPSAG